MKCIAMTASTTCRGHRGTTLNVDTEKAPAANRGPGRKNPLKIHLKILYTKRPGFVDKKGAFRSLFPLVKEFNFGAKGRFLCHTGKRHS
jgi:hypothetical protein